MGILDDLAVAKEQVADRVKTPPIECLVNGKVYNVVFYRAEPEEWTRVTAKHLPRKDILLDIRNGYDIAAVSRAISASCGRVLDGDAEVEMSEEQWADLWVVIPPSTARLLEANVWSLHEHDTEMQIAEAKKASQLPSPKKSRSRRS